MSEDEQAMEAASLYAEDKTFSDIADTLGIAKSFAQVLVRRGISLMAEESNAEELAPETPPEQSTEIQPLPSLETARYESPETGIQPEIYMLETSGIPKRIVLTPKAIMIFDLWKGAGFDGDLSDFLEDSVNYLYQSKRPADRNFE